MLAAAQSLYEGLLGLREAPDVRAKGLKPSGVALHERLSDAGGTAFWA